MQVICPSPNKKDFTPGMCWAVGVINMSHYILSSSCACKQFHALMWKPLIITCSRLYTLARYLDWLSWSTGPPKSSLIYSPASFSLSPSLALSPPLPPQFPLHLTGQGIAAHLTQGGLAQVFFAPAAAYIDKIRLSLALPAISCLIRMSKRRVQFSAFVFLSAGSVI